jgi:hypothetical protein
MINHHNYFLLLLSSLLLILIFYSSCIWLSRGHVDCLHRYIYSGQIKSFSDSTAINNVKISIQNISDLVFTHKSSKLDSGKTDSWGIFKIPSEYFCDCNINIENDNLDSLHIIIDHSLFNKIDTIIRKNDMILRDTIIMLKTIYMKIK